jgi:hypothetical protein
MLVKNKFQVKHPDTLSEFIEEGGDCGEGYDQPEGG